MHPEPRQDGLSQSLVLILSALATATLELAMAEPGSSRALAPAKAVALLVPVLATAWYRGRRGSGAEGPRPAAVGGLLALFLLPLAIEAGRLALRGRAAPLEVPLLAALRNLGLGLAAFAGWRPGATLAALVSLFVILVASALGDGPWVLAMVGGYALAGTLWLMRAYWCRLGLPEAERRFPSAAVVVILGGVGTVVAVAAGGPSRAATILAGFLPSSGGTDQINPDASGGVNDGDDEVKGSEKPKSLGFTDSDVYLESDLPTLYDTFNERYGEPFRRQKQDRLIALSPDQIIEQEKRPVQNLRAGRQFPTVRRRPLRASRTPNDRQAGALVYVKGPTPLHLGLIAYNRFDGRVWHEEPLSRRDFPLELDADGSWLRLALRRPAVFAGDVTHQIKIGALQSNSLPAPAHLARFRVGAVNLPDFFAWGQDGIVRMAQRRIPPGTVIDTEARTIDPHRLLAVEFPPRSVPDLLAGLPDGSDVDPAVAALAREWTAGIPRGWVQVEAVVAALRRGFVHDRAATAPAEVTDTVRHFLLESRRGPDYQFASAAAVLLQSLGYSTRIVGGFYAAPARYDPRTRHTPVIGDDVHVWPEVILPGGTWVAIEPTPGYELMGPARSWAQRLRAALVAAARRLWSHAPALGICAAALGLALRSRREILDRLATLTWSLAAWREPSRRGVLRTLRLVERRCRWAGRARPPGQTPSRWYGSLAAAAPGELRADLERLIRLADWARYAPEDAAEFLSGPEGDVATSCRRAVRGWSLARFRVLDHPPRSKVSPS